jgi:CrcB protein
MTLVYLIVGGAAGTVCRHYLGLFVANQTGSRPAGTFAVNIIGSFAIGVFLQLASERFNWPAGVVLMVAVGFLGGFTTFSALTWQTYQQVEAGDIGSALMNIGLSVGIGLLAVWAGASTVKVAVAG